MTELFGNRADFAIEAGIEPDSQTTSGSIWGHMCVWCLGIALGDLNDRHCGLDGAYLEFDWLRLNLDSLWDDELRGLDDIAAWKLLDGLLYGYHDDVELVDDRTIEDCERDARRWGKFNFLTNWGEQFDGYKSFLVCPPGEFARVLSRRFPLHLGRGVSVTRRAIVGAASGLRSGSRRSHTILAERGGQLDPQFSAVQSVEVLIGCSLFVVGK